jgi:hypothetical protein
MFPALAKVGEYLKECNIGTSRRRNMDDDEMKQFVLSELSLPRSQKRGVRKVWDNLKSNGHHIKRLFISTVWIIAVLMSALQ